MNTYLKTMLRNAIDGQPIREDAGRDYRFQYVHVTDVARASVLALQADVTEHSVFNVTGGGQHSYGDVAALVKERFPEADIQIGEGTISVLDQNAPFDLTRAKTELGYVPLITLTGGLATYAEWLRSHAY